LDTFESMLTCVSPVDSLVAVMSHVVSPRTWTVAGSHDCDSVMALLVEEGHREVQRRGLRGDRHLAEVLTGRRAGRDRHLEALAGPGAMRHRDGVTLIVEAAGALVDTV
jgi:hypothetical protein